MNRLNLLGAAAGFLLASSAAHAGIISIANGDAVVGNRAANLIANGSFELGHPPPPGSNAGWTPGTHVGGYPGNDTAIQSWNASWDANGAYGWWGPVAFSNAPPPDGTNAVYFGNSFTSVTGAPLITASGEITGITGFNHTRGLGPVTLSQTVAGLAVGQSYLLDFWTSGEGGFSGTGLFGLDVGGDLRYLLLPASSNAFGASQRYQVTFVADAANVDITFINWGHVNNISGSGTELVLDDVILNGARVPVPEPASGALLTIGALGLLAARRRGIRRA